jgi:hypothetical protein
MQLKELALRQSGYLKKYIYGNRKPSYLKHSHVMKDFWFILYKNFYTPPSNNFYLII